MSVQILELKEAQAIELQMLKDMDQVCRSFGLKYSLAFGTVLGAVRHKGFIPWDDDIDIMVDIDNYKNFCKVLQGHLPDKYLINSYDSNPEYEYLFTRISMKNISHLDMHIDIFPMVGVPSSALGRKLFSKIAYLIFRCYYIKNVKVNAHYHKNRKKQLQVNILKLIILFIPEQLIRWIFEKLTKAFPIDKSDYLYNFCGLYKYKEIIPKSFFTVLTDIEFENCMFPVPKEWDRYLKQMYGDYMTPKKSNYV